MADLDLDLPFITPYGGEKEDLSLLSEIDGEGPELVVGESDGESKNFQDEIRSIVSKSGVKVDSSLVIVKNDEVDDHSDSESDSGIKEKSKGVDAPTSKAKPKPIIPAVSFAAANAALVKAEAAYQASVEEHEQGSRKSSDQKWLGTVMRSGTLSDRIAALTLNAQSSPSHCLEAVENLLQLVAKKNKSVFMMACDALVDLWINTLLPDQNLLAFRDRDLTSLPSDDVLAAWFHEDTLKRLYSGFISILEERTHDTINTVRLAAMRAAQQLLAAKPEGEAALLSIIVNKLGDPEKQVASRAAYLLQLICLKHPAMSEVVCSEVERFVFRPRVGQRAQYYAVTFLNQIVLSSSKRTLARKLIDIYFTLFDAYISKGELDTKMLSGVLTGVNRAFPFAQSDPQSYIGRVDSLLRGAHAASFVTAVQALSLLFSVMVAGGISSDRIYRALYAKMMDKEFLTSSQQAVFLNLLFRAMKSDPSVPRVLAFIRRLLQIACHSSASLAASSVLLVSELLRCRQEVKKIVVEGIIEKEKDGDGDAKATAKAEAKAGYDPSKRDPQYAGAEKSVIVELECLGRHVHPSVAIFAKKVMNGQKIDYRGDPLHDFSISNFLDRLSFKQPKIKTKPRGVSIMQKNISSNQPEKPANSEEFVQKESDEVAPHEVFIHKFMTQKSSLVEDGKTADKLSRTARKRLEKEGEGEGEGEGKKEKEEGIEGEEESESSESDGEGDLGMLTGEFPDMEDSDLDSDSDLEKMLSMEEEEEDNDDDGGGDDLDEAAFLAAIDGDDDLGLSDGEDFDFEAEVEDEEIVIKGKNKKEKKSKSRRSRDADADDEGEEGQPSKSFASIDEYMSMLGDDVNAKADDGEGGGGGDGDGGEDGEGRKRRRNRGRGKKRRKE